MLKISKETGGADESEGNGEICWGSKNRRGQEEEDRWEKSRRRGEEKKMRGR